MKSYNLALLFSLAALVLFSCQPGDRTTEDKEEKETAKKEAVTDVDTFEFVITALGNTMADISFDMEEIIVTPNAFVRITLINESEDPHMEHNIVFIKSGDVQEIMMAGLQAGRDNDYLPANKDNLIGWSKIAKPGETVYTEFNVPGREGRYKFVCLYPGHIEAMKGELIVSK